MKEVSVNIVIPIYNEEKVIRNTTETIVSFLDSNHLPYNFTITLADNGSTDKTLEICEQLTAKFSQVKVLKIKEKGKGIAIRTAWHQSNADILVFMDADLSSDLKSLPKLIEAIVVEKYDLSIGNRLGKSSKVISRKFMRKIASRIFNFLMRLLFKTGIDDHQCGFKAISKNAFNLVASQLQEKTWFFDTELIVLALRNKLKIKQVDIVWTDTTDSKVALGKTSLDMFKAALAFKKRLKIL